jgi:hypothetical protein
MITIPTGVQFADLALERERGTKRLLYRPEPIAELIRANALDAQALLTSEDLVAWLIAECYFAHRAAGGEPDPVAEEVLAEVASAEASNIPTLQPGGNPMH